MFGGCAGIERSARILLGGGREHQWRIEKMTANDSKIPYPTLTWDEQHIRKFSDAEKKVYREIEQQLLRQIMDEHGVPVPHNCEVVYFTHPLNGGTVCFENLKVVPKTMCLRENMESNDWFILENNRAKKKRFCPNLDENVTSKGSCDHPQNASKVCAKGNCPRMYDPAPKTPVLSCAGCPHLQFCKEAGIGTRRCDLHNEVFYPYDRHKCAARVYEILETFTPRELAQLLHQKYLIWAEHFGSETEPRCQVEFEKLPEETIKALDTTARDLLNSIRERLHSNVAVT